MLRIVSVFSLLILLIAGCITESAPVGQVERLSIRDRFMVEVGDFVNDSILPIYPNPYNRAAGDSVVTFNFWVSDTSETIILVQNPIGEEVVRFEDSTLPPGQYRGSWAPLSVDREPLNSGLYFVTFRTERYIYSRMLSIQTN